MKIEKGIPVPDNNAVSINELVNAMEIGDSIFTDSRKDMARLATACWVVRKRTGRTFLSKSTNTNEVGWRTWRIS